MQKAFESICQEFGNDLVNNIAETDRMEMMNHRRTHLLGDEGNESVMVLF
jgi:hypothetical protein